MTPQELLNVIQAMTPDQRKSLMAYILAGNVDTGEGSNVFVSSGPSAGRTELQGDERLITRAINDILTKIALIDSGVNGFDSRFTRVIGEELGADLESFNALGDNLIQTLAKLKGTVDSGIGGGSGSQGPKGDPGKDGISPHIDSISGNWFIGETDTGVRAEGISPHIDSISGNWFMGETDTGVKAQGPSGGSESSFNWRGPFQLGNMYNTNDVVIGSDGNDYIATSDGLVLPPPSPGWDLFLQGSKVIDNLETDSATDSLSARQGMLLNEMINPDMAEAITYNVPIAELRQFVLDMPRYLQKNTIIKVEAGETSDIINIENFHGPGMFEISGGSNAIGVDTHKIYKMIIKDTQIRHLYIHGFEAITAANEPGFYIQNDTSSIGYFSMYYLSRRNGTKTSTNTDLIRADNCIVYARNLYAENQYCIIRAVLEGCNVTADECFNGNNNLIGMYSLYGASMTPTARINHRIDVADYPTDHKGGGRAYSSDYPTPPVHHRIYGVSSARTTISVPIEKLQIFFTGFSRYLERDYTILVGEGMLDETIIIDGFYGPGSFMIIGGGTITASFANATLSKVGSFLVRGCSCKYITIRNFTLLHTSGIGVHFTQNSLGYGELYYVIDEGGANSVVGHYFAQFAYMGRGVVTKCRASNKNRVLSVITAGIVLMYDMEGSSNNTNARVEYGGLIHLYNTVQAGAISNASVFSGQIWDSALGQGYFLPLNDNLTDLGATSRRFRNFYTGTATINTSGIDEKKDVEKIPDRLNDLFMLLDPVQFRFKDGTSDRIHMGFIAQKVEQALSSLGIDSKDFAAFVKSPITEKQETGEYEEVDTGLFESVPTGETVVDIYGHEIPVFNEIPIIEKRPIMKKIQIGERYGLRYSEFIPLIVKMVQMHHDEIKKLTEQISSLQNKMPSSDSLYSLT